MFLQNQELFVDAYCYLTDFSPCCVPLDRLISSNESLKESEISMVLLSILCHFAPTLVILEICLSRGEGEVGHKLTVYDTREKEPAMW